MTRRLEDVMQPGMIGLGRLSAMRNEFGGHVLQLLEESRMECVRDKVNARSEQLINDYLRQNRLV